MPVCTVTYIAQRVRFLPLELSALIQMCLGCAVLCWRSDPLLVPQKPAAVRSSPLAYHTLSRPIESNLNSRNATLQFNTASATGDGERVSTNSRLGYSSPLLFLPFFSVLLFSPIESWTEIYCFPSTTAPGSNASWRFVSPRKAGIYTLPTRIVRAIYYIIKTYFHSKHAIYY